MTRPQAVFANLRASFWFLPALVVLLSLGLAAFLVDLDGAHDWQLALWSPRLFGASADGSRALLSAIATSMVTVAGVVFSITVVVLSQASAQYSPRVLRNFMRDRPTQLVLGVFVGVFAYCIVVLRTVRAGDVGQEFIPSIAVLGAMLYAIGAIAMLIFFVHHIANGIQASSIVERIGDDTRTAIDHLYPEGLGKPAAPERPVGERAAWTEVRGGATGYVVSVDAGRLEQLAVDGKRLLRLCVRIGDFVSEGQALVAVAGAGSLPPKLVQSLRAAVLIGPQRTTDQDPGFGFQQLVDVALKALSPGVNDTSTALLCIDWAGALLARLASREMPAAHRWVEGEIRVIAPAPSFDDILRDTMLPLLANARGDMRVLARIAGALGRAARAACTPERRAAVHTLSLDLEREVEASQPQWRTAETRALVRALVVESAEPGEPAPPRA